MIRAWVIILVFTLCFAGQAAKAETFTLRGVTFSESVYLSDGQL